eukprot:TRINITY_DN1135_c1_g1_i2.p1 TRINITY_DN1135_c1_g1~~TRINITY_DN1135_c1_g1_i2.p1  ORF type:complete len:104 (+),score=22.14 TRINITY_DN1135_c1_g1_i2:168-479(+)
MCKLFTRQAEATHLVARAEMADAASAEFAVNSLPPPAEAPEIFVTYQRVTDMQPSVRRLVAMGYRRADVEKALAEAHEKGRRDKAALQYAAELLISAKKVDTE